MGKSAILSIRIVSNAKDAERGLDRTGRSVDRLGRSAKRNSAQLNQMFRGLDDGARIARRVGAVSVAVQALTVTSVAATKALAPLAGLAAAVPGAAAGAAAAMATFKVATNGFADAVSLATEGGEKFAEATKRLPPAMVGAVKATADLGKAFEGVQRSVQASFWSGIAAQVTALGNVALPVLRDSMTAVAKAGNGVFRELLRVAATQPVMDALRASFDLARRALDNLTPAVAPFVTGIALIVKSSAGLLGGFNGASGAAAKFLGWAKRITSDGTLRRWFEDGKKAAADLGRLVREAARVLGAIASAAASAAGSAGLGKFADAVKRIADTLSSPAMKDELTKTFKRAGDIASGATQAFIAILPFLVKYGDVILAIGLAYKGVMIIMALYNLACAASAVAQTAMGAAGVKALGLVALAWAKTAAVALLNAAKMALAWVISLGPIGLVVLAIAAVVAILVVAYLKCAWFRDKVNAAFTSVKQWVVNVWNGIVAKVSSAWSSIARGASNLRARIAAAFNSVRTSATSTWNGIVAKVRSAWSSVTSATSSVASRIRQYFSGAAASIKAAFGGVVGSVVGVFSSIAGAASNAARRVAGVFGGIMSRARSVASFVGGLFGSGTMWVRAAVPSNLPEVGRPFYMEAAGLVNSPTRWGSASSAPTGDVINVTVNGAIDPNETARQIERILNRSARRDGKAWIGATAW